MDLPFLKKYQPKKYKDFIIEKEYISLLVTLIHMNAINILFIGGPGTGKTSLLEATIREYYNLDEIPKNNVLYINNLHEQGISYYRTEVKTFCQTSSNIPQKKKFIILDDIDNITEQSQQVFRNCIDKYSQNIHFLSSCINPQKVIESIQSRINIVKLNQFTDNQLENIFDKIKINEKITIDDKSKKFIISISNNSIRILINYLEKFKLLKLPINLQLAHQVCTNILFIDFDKFTSYCKNNDINTAIKIIFEIYNQGFSVMDILDNYFIYIKLTNSIDEDLKFEIIKIICTYITIFHIVHEDEIELSLFTNNIISVFNK